MSIVTHAYTIIAEIESGKHPWVYYNSKQSASFAKALADKNYKVNCNLGCCWAIQMEGDLAAGQYFWGRKDGTVVYCRGSKETLQKNGYQFIHINGKKTVSQAVKDGTLIVGDVVTYYIPHTNMYLGGGYWLDTGHGYNGNSGDNAPMKKCHGKTIYGDQKVAWIIRKTGTKKVYRVRIGIYGNDTVMNNTAAILKEAGYQTFADPVKGGKALYCGAFLKRKNAETRVKELKEIKVSGKALSPAIVEVFV